MTLTVAEALALFKAGESLYIPGASAEPVALTRSLSKNKEQLPALHITHSFIPGINRSELASASNNIHETCFFPRNRELMQQGQVTFLPLSYFGVQRFLRSQSFDWACLQVAPPDADGNCSLGPSIEFLPSVLKRTKKILALINPQVPRATAGPTIPLQQLDVCVQSNAALNSYLPAAKDPVSDRIATQLLPLIAPGAVLQLGLGNVPSQLTEKLTALKNLRFHSGLLSDGFASLWRAGALDPHFQHTTCCALGSDDFYTQLPALENLRIAGVEYTHAPTTLAQYDRLTAINTGLEVDLWGQANLEMLDGRQISSVGGAADFARAAGNSSNGKSIIALPATAANGSRSRIKASLNAAQVVSLGRQDIDYVVTEHGSAELKGKAIADRAEALIQIAAPKFQDTLRAEWRTLLKKTIEVTL